MIQETAFTNESLKEVLTELSDRGATEITRIIHFDKPSINKGATWISFTRGEADYGKDELGIPYVLAADSVLRKKKQ